MKALIDVWPGLVREKHDDRDFALIDRLEEVRLEIVSDQIIVPLSDEPYTMIWLDGSLYLSYDSEGSLDHIGGLTESISFSRGIITIGGEWGLNWIDWKERAIWVNVDDAVVRVVIDLEGQPVTVSMWRLEGGNEG